LVPTLRPWSTIPWIVVALLAAIVVGQQALGARVGDALRLLQLLRNFDQAAERGDTDALVDLFHADAEHRGLTTGRLVRGRGALREVFSREMTDESADSVDTEIVAFRFVTPEVLVGDVTVHYTNYRLEGLVWPQYREHSFVVATRREGRWRIAATSAGGDDPED
jgi:uncharacterized protein (TIGR02246 family)